MNQVMLVAVGDKDWPIPAIKGVRAGRVVVNCAAHNPVAHILGEVCIHLNGYSQRDKAKIKKKYGYDRPHLPTGSSEEHSANPHP